MPAGLNLGAQGWFRWVQVVPVLTLGAGGGVILLPSFDLPMLCWLGVFPYRGLSTYGDMVGFGFGWV